MEFLEKVRYFFFVITNTFIYGFGFAYPNERKEFDNQLNRNDIIDQNVTNVKNINNDKNKRNNIYW